MRMATRCPSALVRRILRPDAEWWVDVNGLEASLRAAVASAIRAQDPDASEAAMRSLVEMGWRRVVAENAEDSRRTDDNRRGTP